jgi:hypothetical protein
VDAGEKRPEVCRQLGISDRTFYALWVDSRDPPESTVMKNDGVELEITRASVAYQL